MDDGLGGIFARLSNRMGSASAKTDRNSRALAALLIAVGVLFLIFGQYKVFGREFTLDGGFQSWVNRFIAEGAYPLMVPILRGVVLPHGTAIAFLVAYGELAIGLGLAVGLFVRPASVSDHLYVSSSNRVEHSRPLSVSRSCAAVRRSSTDRHDEKLVAANNVATFSDTKISQSNWNDLSSKDYYVTINVVSARKSSKDNLLNCSVPIDRISTFGGKSTQVFCRLIGERDGLSQ
jgi:uncharacterized membrane protein YphA (DoxX/SURF4 family)